MQLRPSIRLLSTLLLPVPLILAGCSTFGGKEEASSIEPIDFSRFPQDETQLVRRWEWKRSVYPRFGEDPAVLTPTTTDRTETLVFPTPDTVRVYRSDTLARHTSREAFFRLLKVVGEGEDGGGALRRDIVGANADLGGPDASSHGRRRNRKKIGSKEEWLLARVR